MTREEFAALAADGPIILDGAVGTNLYREGMPRGVCTEEWIYEHPETIAPLQKAYVEAGTQILYAPTFSANRVALKGFCLADRLEEINTGIVKATKKNVGGTGVLVAGDLTPTGQMLEPFGPMSYEKLLDVYREQIRILEAAGVDLLVAETMLGVEETMAVVDAAMQVTELPILCSLSLSADGHAIYDGTGVEAVETLQAMGASAVGLNCSVGPDQLEAVVRSMRDVAEVPLLVKPNAGMPFINEKGDAIYSMTPEKFAEHMEVLVAAGAGLVGGCCGTSPAYIRALCRRLGR
ncbi:MAG: homocysteine S-methyltransferase family protein [Lachnospiraceae bacterium]|nr:homocysteine S-methyltransferase family protein [Lachnospiraceae bacterium]